MRGINFKSELKIPLIYKIKVVTYDHFCDFSIEDLIVPEIKSVASLMDIHRAQVLNYINLLKKPKALVVNFDVKNLYYDGQETFVNKYYEMLLQKL